MKNNNRGWPSSDNKNVGFENDVTSWTNRVEAETLKFLKYGAELDSAMTRAGYRELRVPDVVATIEYIDCDLNEYGKSQGEA